MLHPDSGIWPLEILVLISQLPMESRTMARLRPGGGDQFRGWGVDRYRQADLLDAIRENTYAIIATAPRKKTSKKPKPPEPVYRPEKVAKGRKPNMFRMMAAQQLKAAKSSRGD